MSKQDKNVDDGEKERYKSLGFKAQFDGTAAGLPWSELIEELKTNVLRQPLRVRSFIMGEYRTKAGDQDLARIPNPLPEAASWIRRLQRLWRPAAVVQAAVQT